MAGDEDADGPGPVYGPEAGARLAALKRHYDPANLFRVNHNIPRAVTSGRPSGPLWLTHRG